MATEFSGRGKDRSYSGLVRSFGRVGGPGYIPFAGASEAAPRPGQVHESMRAKAAKKAQPAAKKVTVKPSPVSVRRIIGPTLRPGTRQAKLDEISVSGGRANPRIFTRSFSADINNIETDENRARSTFETQEVGKEQPSTPANPVTKKSGTRFDNPEYVWDDERTDKQRLSDAEWKQKQGRLDAEAKKAVKGARIAEKAGVLLDSAGRVGGPWGTRGAGLPDLRRQQASGLGMLDEVTDARAKRGKAKRQRFKAEADRQSKAGVRSPAITRDDVRAREERIRRSSVGQLGEPVPEPKEKVTIPRPIVNPGKKVWSSRFGNIPPFGGVYPNRPSTIAKLESLPTYKPKGGGAAKGLLGAFIEPVIAAGVGAVRAAVDDKVTAKDAFNWWKKKYTSDPLKKQYGNSRMF